MKQLSALSDFMTRLFNKPFLRFLVILLPFMIGGLISILAQAFYAPVPLVAFKIDIGMLAFLFGLFLTFLVAAYYFGIEIRAWYARQDEDEIRREIEAERRRFIRRLDHEIKNPLTGLQAALVNIQEASVPVDRQRAGENARLAVVRLKRLLADLRKLAELEDRPVEHLAVDIPTLLEDVTEAVQALPAAQKQKINLLISRVPWPFPPVTGDRDLLSLVFYNLIENAVKFTSKDDSVEVRALEDGKAIVVEVADSGPGIPPDELNKIFEELYRGVNARGIEGSGLGLALARRIVALHDGQMEVRSNQENPRGTVFTVRLPVVKK
jgi:signal transduction histidine kinase